MYIHKFQQGCFISIKIRLVQNFSKPSMSDVCFWSEWFMKIGNMREFYIFCHFSPAIGFECQARTNNSPKPSHVQINAPTWWIRTKNVIHTQPPQMRYQAALFMDDAHTLTIHALYDSVSSTVKVMPGGHTPWVMLLKISFNFQSVDNSVTEKYQFYNFCCYMSINIFFITTTRLVKKY